QPLQGVELDLIELRSTSGAFLEGPAHLINISANLFVRSLDDVEGPVEATFLDRDRTAQVVHGHDCLAPALASAADLQADSIGVGGVADVKVRRIRLVFVPESAKSIVLPASHETVGVLPSSQLPERGQVRQPCDLSQTGAHLNWIGLVSAVIRDFHLAALT